MVPAPAGPAWTLAAVTVRQVLTHRAGVPVSFGHPGVDMALMAD
jgi:CubicO group peptidase (beta-lactamase class C family)